MVWKWGRMSSLNESWEFKSSLKLLIKFIERLTPGVEIVDSGV